MIFNKLCILIAVVGCCNIAVGGEDFLRFTPSEIDLGKRITGEKVFASTSIENISDQEVIIKMVKSSCHCTIVKKDFFHIKPGESVDLEFEIDGAGVDGAFKKQSWIFTEKPDSKVYTLNIKGNFESQSNHFFASLEKLYLGSTNYRNFIRYITLKRTGSVSIGSFNIESSKPWIKTDVVELNDKAARIKVMLDVPPSVSSIQEDIRILGSNPNDFLRIRVLGQINPSVSPSRSVILVNEKKKIYPIYIEFQNKKMKKLVSHEFTGNGLRMFKIKDSLDIEVRPQLLVGIEKLPIKQNLLTGKLLLYFAGEKQPTEIKFVSANAEF
jgi:hypothetical protein